MGRKAVTVSLPEDLVKEANGFCRRREMSLSEVTRESLRDYLYRQKMEEARRWFGLHVQKLGIHSEEELVRRLED